MDDGAELHLRRTLAEAEAIQSDLARRVELRPLKAPPLTIAAVDADYGKTRTYAAAVLFNCSDSSMPIEIGIAVRPTAFPYISGYLSLREAPAVIDALAQLSHPPDLVLVDGQGIAHPRRFGIACHIGVLTGIPSIGCAKNRLVGDYEEPGPRQGDWSPLQLNGEVVGAVLRTRSGVKPLFVSPGHLVMLEETIQIVLRCATRYRVPEPLRIADSVARATRAEWLSA